MEWVQKRRAFALATIFALLVMLMCGTGRSSAAYGQTSQNGISLNVCDMELSKIVRMLMRDSDKSIVIRDQDGLQSKKVTLNLNNMPFEQVLKYAVDSAGGVVERDANGVYVISSSSAAPMVTSMAVTPDASAAQAVDVRRETTVDVIKLYNQSPAQMMGALGLNQAQENKGSKKSNKLNPGTYVRNENGNLNNIGSPDLLTPSLEDSLKPDTTSAQRSLSASDESLQFGGGGRGSSGGGGMSGSRSGGGMSGGRSGGSSGGRSGGLIPEGIDTIVPYSSDNSLIVRGTDEAISELKDLIRQLDIAPKQIMIKAEFVEIDTDSTQSLGVDWSLSRYNTSFATSFGGSGNIALGWASGNVMANLTAQMQRGRAKVVNAPMILTQNNTSSNIDISTQIPYWTSTTVVNNGQTVTSSTPEFLDVSTQLEVLPTVNAADNTITVQITPTISDVGEYFTGPEGDQIPATTSQSLFAIARVGNGETIVLGGIIRKSEQTNSTGIPFLRDLPIIGPLFRSDTNTVSDKELLIFLTPTIRPEKSAGATGVGVLAP